LAEVADQAGPIEPQRADTAPAAPVVTTFNAGITRQAYLGQASDGFPYVAEAMLSLGAFYRGTAAIRGNLELALRLRDNRIDCAQPARGSAKGVTGPALVVFGREANGFAMITANEISGRSVSALTWIGYVASVAITGNIIRRPARDEGAVLQVQIVDNGLMITGNVLLGRVAAPFYSFDEAAPAWDPLNHIEP
jgi:hypothetical protein